MRVDYTKVELDEMAYPSITLCEWFNFRSSELSPASNEPPKVITKKTWDLECGSKMECLGNSSFGINIQTTTSLGLNRKNATHHIEFHKNTENRCFTVRGHKTSIPGEFLAVRVLKSASVNLNWSVV